MVVEFKTRYGYILNPNTGIYVKQKYNDLIEYEYPDYSTTAAAVNDLSDTWQRYLDNQ